MPILDDCKVIALAHEYAGSESPATPEQERVLIDSVKTLLGEIGPADKIAVGNALVSALTEIKESGE